MRKIFQKWLFLFVAAAFAVTFVLSFSIQTQQARLNAVGLIRLKIDDARKQIEANRRNVAAIRELTDAAARAKARALAEMIALKPGLLEDRSELEKVRLRLDADELHVSDEKGILIASIPSIYEGYDMASAAQSAAFLPALTNPAFVLVQDPQRKGADGEVFQYAGVARADRPGIVQIGYQPKRLQEAMDIAAIENLSAGFRIGKAGRILIVRDGRIVSIDDQTFLGRPVQDYGLEPARLEAGGAFAAAIGGRRCIGVTGRHRDFIIVGLLPQEEMYLGRNEMGMFLVTGNVILFAVVFVLVSYLVQRVVIDGIYSVNRSLEKITRGDLSERVEVKTNAEFVLLSEGINSTVAALKKAIAEAAARIDAELQLARAIQRSSLPHVFAAPPGRSNYTIHAVMHAAREVGAIFTTSFPSARGSWPW